MEIDLSGLPDNRRKRAMGAFTSTVAWLVVVLICLITIGGLAWVAQLLWRSVLSR